MRMLTTFATLVALATPVWAEPPTPTITVTGDGQVAAAPDMATISLGITTQGDTAKAALDANSTALAGVLDRLKGGGIDPKDIQTSGLSLNPQFDYNQSSGATQKIIGYVASNMVTVAVRKIDTLGATLDSVVSDGANTLNGVTFGLQDPDPVLDEARKAAVAEAQRRAQLYANAAGVRLGGILSISEQAGGMPPVPMMTASFDKAAAVPVETGQLQIGAAVSITWLIAQ